MIAFRFCRVVGKTRVIVFCAGCERHLHAEREPVWADLNGPGFEAYYCATCTGSLIEGLADAKAILARERLKAARGGPSIVQQVSRSAP